MPTQLFCQVFGHSPAERPGYSQYFNSLWLRRDLVIVNTSIVYGCERPGYSQYFNSLWLRETWL